MVYVAFIQLQTGYDQGRIGLMEYCARRYELASYVRSSNPLPSSKGGTYVHPTQWSITYPDFWRVDDHEPEWVRLSRGMAIVGIHTGANVSGKSLDEVTDAWLRGWEQHIGTEFTVIDRRRLTLPSDLPAIEVVHYMGRGVVGKSRKVFVVVKDRAFLIDAETYLEAWPRFESDFSQIVESFRVME